MFQNQDIPSAKQIFLNPHAMQPHNVLLQLTLSTDKYGLCPQSESVPGILRGYKMCLPL